MSVIDARDTFAVRRAETEAERVDMDRHIDRATAIDRMVAQLRRKGHPTAEIAASLRIWAEIYTDKASKEQHR